MSVSKMFNFPDDMWHVIKQFAGINGIICCQCEGYYFHCWKKYYESLYKKIYEKHSIWKYIFKKKQNYNFEYKFNCFNKNKKLILKYILLEKNNSISSRKIKNIENLIRL